MPIVRTAPVAMMIFDGLVGLSHPLLTLGELILPFTNAAEEEIALSLTGELALVAWVQESRPLWPGH